MTTNVTSPLPGQRGQSRFAAYTASAALRREHVGALWIGTVESFGLRHSRGRSVSLIRALQAKHRSTSALDAAMVLLKSVIKVATRPVPHMIAELGPNGSGIG